MSGMPIGHISWNFGNKKYLSFPQVLQFVEGGFQNNFLLRATCELPEVGHLRCFDASIIMRDRVGEYGLEGNIWVIENMRILNLDCIY